MPDVDVMTSPNVTSRPLTSRRIFAKIIGKKFASQLLKYFIEKKLKNYEGDEDVASGIFRIRYLMK